MEEDKEDSLCFEKAGEIGIVRINRPTALNSLNHQMLKELLHLVVERVPQEQCKALILTGAGEKSFIAGADIKEMSQYTSEQMLHFCQLGQQLTLALEEASFLTIAAVNGYALGGGLEMALACDFIYAVKHAKLGFPEVTLGIIPGFGGTQRFSRAVGSRLAKELIMSGRIFTAEEGVAYGIINKVCEISTLLTDAQQVAREIVRHSFLAVSQAKAAVNAGVFLGIHEGLALERNLCAVCFGSEERAKGMYDFLEKRKNE
jgi:enoyl-CoA hydratase